MWSYIEPAAPSLADFMTWYLLGAKEKHWIFCFVVLGSNLLGSIKPNTTVRLNTKMHKFFSSKKLFLFWFGTRISKIDSQIKYKDIELKLCKIVLTSKETKLYLSIFGINDDLFLVKIGFLHALHYMAAVQYNSIGC